MSRVENHAIFKITRFQKSRDFQNHAIFKITRFSKSRDFQNHAIFKNLHVLNPFFKVFFKIFITYKVILPLKYM